MEVGVFIPINNNGWLISETAPQYMPSFDLNKRIALKAEEYGLDFLLSMIKLRGFGGKTEFWEYGLESFTLMAAPTLDDELSSGGLAYVVTSRLGDFWGRVFLADVVNAGPTATGRRHGRLSKPGSMT